MKNVFLISFGFTLLFTAYNSAAALQSSVNKVHYVLTTVILLTISTFKKKAFENNKDISTFMIHKLIFQHENAQTSSKLTSNPCDVLIFVQLYFAYRYVQWPIL